MPYLDHTVTLDPAVKDVFGLPVARITWSTGKYEQVAQQFYIPELKKMMTHGRGRRWRSRCRPRPTAAALPTGFHIMGGMMMGADPPTSVTDSVRAGARPGQRVRRRRFGLRHLGRAQPDEHDHGRGAAEHAPPGRDGRARGRIAVPCSIYATGPGTVGRSWMYSVNTGGTPRTNVCTS